MQNAYTQATDAMRDAVTQYVADGEGEAKAERNECPCCMAYDRPGMIHNAGQWIRCPMCNAAKAS